MSLGNIRSRPVRRHRLFGATLAAVSAIMVLVVASASGNLTGSTFESTDGNLIKNTGSDWCNTVASNVCTATAPNLAKGQDTAPGNGDDAFANGTKQDDAVPSVGGGGVPNKGDLDRFYVANELVSSKNFVYLGFELLPVPNASASVHMGFEFNKNYCDPATHAGCSANNVTPTRSAGDILIVFDLEGGGTPQLSFRRWVLSGACEISQDTAPCWGTKQGLSASVADGNLNSVDVTDPINPGAPRTIGQYRFGEAAINLTDSNILTGCAGLGSVYTVSRSSGDSGTATMKDFIKPQRVNINNCGTIVVRKVTDPVSDTTTSFGFTAAGGLSPTSFSLVNGGTPRTFSGVNPGNGYSVSESTVASGWDLTSATCDDGSPVSNIDVSAGETVTCTFTNTKRLGAIRVTKQSSKDSSNLAGASFSIIGPGSFSSTIGPTGSNGTACIDNLPWSGTGTNYTVTETTAPAGYGIDNTSGVTVSVNQNATCSSGTPNAPPAFTDTPLSKIQVKFFSLAGAGVTKSQIICKKGTPAAYSTTASVVPATNEANGGSGENGSADDETTPAFDDTDEIFGNGAATGVAHTTLVPGMYTCTINIDP